MHSAILRILFRHYNKIFGFCMKAFSALFILRFHQCFKISKPDLKGRECDGMGMIRDKIRVLYLLLLFCIHMAWIHYSLTAARQLHNPPSSAIEQRQLCDRPTILVPTINLRLFSVVFIIQHKKTPRGVNDRGH